MRLDDHAVEAEAISPASSEAEYECHTSILEATDTGLERPEDRTSSVDDRTVSMVFSVYV
jgi:hypothetical protein